MPAIMMDIPGMTSMTRLRGKVGMGKQVNLRYSRTQLLTLYNWAWIENVERGGRYDTPLAAIDVWTHPWTTPEERQVTRLKGRFYLDWTHENQLTEVAVAEGFSESDIYLSPYSGPHAKVDISSI